MPSPSRAVVESFFLEAVELPRAERDAFLSDRCGDDADLMNAVKELIAADEEAGEGAFLDSALFAGEQTGPGAKHDAAAAPGTSEHENTDSETPWSDSTSAPSEQRFRILHAHRQGGLGEVLLAHDRQLDRDVAIKQIRSNYRSNTEAQQRFVQEAKVTGRLEHPGVVPVYAMGNWPDGGHYYAMRFIEGDTMKDVIEAYHQSETESESGQLQLRELLSRFVDVCNTIEYAHSRNVLHRDIKPSNIMVGPYAETLVVDWGLAKLLDESNETSMTEDLANALRANASQARTKTRGDGSTPTRVGGTIGTPQYMSPEQAAGKIDEMSTKTDVYLLGATLYQILTGKPPHHEDSVSRLLKRIRSGILVPPRQASHSVDPALESICLTAMATQPGERYSSAIAIAEDVNRWMADQRVSVHRESYSKKISRWMRHHRTVTTSMAVASVLVLIGGVIGSSIRNDARLQRLRADQERQTAELESKTKETQRLTELIASANSAESIAATEIRQSRFSSALGVLENVLPAIDKEPSLAEQAERIRARADRMRAIVEFYKLRDYVQDQNILSRDTKALIAGEASLRTLGIWEHQDWWNKIPGDDLSAAQRDSLCWDIYQQMMLIDAMLIKTIGVRLSGDGRIGGAAGMLRVGGRFLTTDAGKPEAEAAIVVSDRMDHFRVSESTRFYRSIAQKRLGLGRRLQGSDLGLTENAPDAHSLAVLSLIAAVDPSFEMVFRGYERSDALLTARDQFRRSAALQPSHYISHLGLGQVEYLLASREPELTWEDLEPCVQAFSHCITLDPDRCFALNDRSSIYRIQASLIANDARYDASQRKKRSMERLQWSLVDGRRAMRSYSQHPWVGWQTGFVHAEMDRFDQAMKLWNQTAIDTLPLGEISDATFLKVDDLRGRAQIADWLETRLDRSEFSDRASAFTVLAGIRLNQLRNQDAMQAAESALKIDPHLVQARAVRGMVLLREAAYATAQPDLEFVAAANSNHPWGQFGLAKCAQHRGDDARAADFFELAEQRVVTRENQAAVLLGLGQSQALCGKFDRSQTAIRRAIELEPACEWMGIVRYLAKQISRWKRSGEAPPERIEALTEMLKPLAQVPRGTNFQSMAKASTFDQRIRASVFNGDFELGSLRYWDLLTDSDQTESAGQRSSAEVINEDAHSGDFSLRLMNSRSGTSVAQEFSAKTGQNYEVSCWAKTDGLKDGDAKILGPDGAVLLEFHGLDSSWSRQTCRWTVQQDLNRPAGRGDLVPTKLSVSLKGIGTLWVDDFVVETTP